MDHDLAISSVKSHICFSFGLHHVESPIPPSVFSPPLRTKHTKKVINGTFASKRAGFVGDSCTQVSVKLKSNAVYFLCLPLLWGRDDAVKMTSTEKVARMRPTWSPNQAWVALKINYSLALWFWSLELSWKTPLIDWFARFLLSWAHKIWFYWFISILVVWTIRTSRSP